MFQSRQQAFSGGQAAAASRPARTPKAKKPRGPQMDMTSPFGRTTDGTPITQSVVSAQSPYTGSQLNAYTQARTPVPTQYGMGSGDRTRQAFAQAAAMQQANSANKGYEDLARAYRARQEQTRAGDLEAMRADQVRRYGMDEDYIAKRRNQEIERVERIKDLRNRVQVEQANARTRLGENLTGLFLSGMMPVAGAYAQNAFRTGGVGGIFGGLFR